MLLITTNSKKVKVPLTRPDGPEGSIGIALLFLDLGTRRRWVVNTTPGRFTPGKTQYRGWVGPEVGLDVFEKAPIGIFFYYYYII
jgi:hypothetical protein